MQHARGATRAVVFVGPSLPGHARPALPGVRELFPVRRGDVEEVLATHPALEAIGVIDGVFHHALAVSPRELRAAVTAGVRVLGSSSMGALRAAELRDDGMIGVGEIFRMFAEGEVSADDEVAITFDPDTRRATCEPLVNVRASVAALRRAGALPSDAAEAIVAAARALPYAERVYPAILAHASAAVGRDLRPFRGRLAAHDQKREDAAALYRELEATLAASSRRPDAVR